MKGAHQGSGNSTVGRKTLLAMISPWRRTGQAASSSHFDGICPGTLLEAPAYNDEGKQQGHLLIMLVEKDQVGQATDGQLWLGHVLSVQDE